MKFSLKAVALSALVASVAVAAPIEKRDAASDRLAACFVGLLFTGSWPGSCQAAVEVNLGLIKSIAINQMSMDFTPANAWGPSMSSNSVVATMISIPGITLPIDTIRQHIIISDNGVQLGNFDTPWSASSVSGGTLTTSFAASTLNVFSTSHAAFSNFVSALSTSATHPVGLQGTVDAQLNLGVFGRLTLPGIGFSTSVTFTGLNNLSGTKYLYLIDIAFGGVSMGLGSVINIPNPSKLTLDLGDVSFSTSYLGSYVGVSNIKNLVLAPGNNYVLSSTTLDLTLAAADQFLNDQSIGDATLTLNGYNGTSSNAALDAGLGSLKSSLTIPANFNGLVMSQAPYTNWSLKVLSTSATDYNVQITATFQSPYYGLPVTMYAAAGPGQLNYAFADGVSTDTNQIHLFNIKNDLVYSVSGTGTTTVTFNASLPGPFQAIAKPKWQELVTYGAAHGYIPIQFNWQATIIVGNDGVQRIVDWGNTGTGLSDIHIAVGSDFANVLNAFPA